MVISSVLVNRHINKLAMRKVCILFVVCIFVILASCTNVPLH